MSKVWKMNLTRCTGCRSCSVGCVMENNLVRDMFYRWVVDTQNRTIPATNAEKRFVSMACYHCANPACLDACPTASITKDGTTGAVIIEDDTCVGCRRCAAACPYGAPQFNTNTGKMEKCHMCHHRLVAGLQPACIMTCIGRALSIDEHTVNTPGGTAPTGFALSAMTNPQVLWE